MLYETQGYRSKNPEMESLIADISLRKTNVTAFDACDMFTHAIFYKRPMIIEACKKLKFGPGTPEFDEAFLKYAKGGMVYHTPEQLLKIGREHGCKL